MATALSRFVREFVRKAFPTEENEIVAIAGTSTTTIVAASALADPQKSSGSLDGGWFYVYSGTCLGDERRIVEYAPTATSTYGTVTLNRALSATPDATTTALVYTGPLAPRQIKHSINEALRTSRHVRTQALTLVADGLMEAAGTASWSQVGTCTITKDTTAATVNEGVQALKTVNGAVSSGASSVAIGVTPQESFALEVVLTPGAFTGRVQAYNATAGSVIAQQAITSANSRQRVRLTFQIPTGCLSLTIRLLGDQAAATVFWDEVVLLRLGDTLIPLPSDVTDEYQITRVLERVDAQGGAVAAYNPRSSRPAYVSGWTIIPDVTGATKFLLDLSKSDWQRGRALYLEGMLPYAELATDGATTPAELEYITLRARALAFAGLAETGPADSRDHYAERAKRLAGSVVSRSASQPRRSVPIGGRRR